MQCRDIGPRNSDKGKEVYTIRAPPGELCILIVSPNLIFLPPVSSAGIIITFMSFSVSVLGHPGRGLYNPSIIESRVSARWLHSVAILPTSIYLPLNVTISYPGGGFTFRHRFSLDEELRTVDFCFSPGWLQLCSRHIPGASLELSDGSSLSIPSEDIGASSDAGDLGPSSCVDYFSFG